MADVFISYSRKDKDFVQRLDEALKQRGREAWIDKQGIRAAEEWMQAIHSAIEGADTFLFVLSPDSIISKVCPDEIAHAVAHNKRIVPVVARDVEEKQVPESLAKLNYIFCRESDDFEAKIKDIVAALDTDLDWVHAHTRLLTRALEWEAKGKNDSFALRGDDLRDAELWLTKAGTDKNRQPTALQTEYIIGSRKAAARRQRFLLGGVTVAMIVTIALAFVAYVNAGKANKSANAARQAERKVSQSASNAQVSLSHYSLDAGNMPRTLAHLAQALRLNPQNADAVSNATALLLGKEFSPISVPLEHRFEVTSARFSPDGRRIATSSKDGTAQIWDAKTGKPEGPPTEHPDSVDSIRFSPDGLRVVTTCSDKTARVWTVITGRPIGKPMPHRESVRSVEFSSDGERILTFSGEISPFRLTADTGPDTVQVWDAGTGAPIGEPVKSEGKIHSAQFSPDGSPIVITTDYATVQLWVSGIGSVPGNPMVHQGGVNLARLSPDCRHLVTISAGPALSNDSVVKVWDTATRELVGKPMPHAGYRKSAQFSPDGQRVVTATGKIVQIWDAHTGQPIGTPNSLDEVEFAQFSPDGQRLATLSKDAVQIWDATTGKPIGAPLEHQQSVTNVEFSPDGERIVTTSGTTARIWKATASSLVDASIHHTAPAEEAAAGPASALNEDIVYTARYSLDDRTALIVSPDNTARLCNAATSEPIGNPMPHSGPVFSAQLSPDGRRVLTRMALSVGVWDSATGGAITNPKLDGPMVESAQFSPDSRSIVIGFGDGTARLWDTETGKPIGEVMKHQGSVSVEADFSPDGRRIVTAGRDHTVRLWEASTGKSMGVPLPCETEVFSFSAKFSRDGQRIVITSKAITSNAKSVRIWDAPTREKIDSPEDIVLLAELCEAIGGAAFVTSGQTEVLAPIDLAHFTSTRSKIAARFASESKPLTPLQRFLKWQVSDTKTRTISPLSDLTVPAYVDERVKNGDIAGLRAAMGVDPANPKIAAQLARCLAHYSLDKESDFLEARRARGEADFLSRRALRLPPDNAEIRKLRAEVEKLLNTTPAVP